MYFKEILKDTGNINENFTYKIIVIGDSGVGKSNFIHRFFGKVYKPNSISTIGVELFSKTYEAMYTKGNKSCCDIIRVNVWDTAGQERYKSVASSYYKGSKGVLILYDTTKYDTFENVDNWVNDTNLYCSPGTSIMLVGTKSDLYNLKVVEYSMLEEKAELKGKNNRLIILMKINININIIFFIILF